MSLFYHPSTHHFSDPHQFSYSLDSFIIHFRQKNTSVTFLAYDNVNHKPFGDRLTNPTLTDFTFDVVQSLKMC